LALPPGAMLFLSDVAAELDAAATAGLATCQLVRPADGTLPSGRHPEAVDFPEVAIRFALPRG
jgi:enolase-phosphatase E1